MNLGELTEKDCELLLEAIDAWETAPISDALQNTFVSGIKERFAGSPSELSVKQEIQSAQQKIQARRRISILLKAKVELIRQGIQGSALGATERSAQL